MISATEQSMQLPYRKCVAKVFVSRRNISITFNLCNHDIVIQKVNKTRVITKRSTLHSSLQDTKLFACLLCVISVLFVKICESAVFALVSRRVV